MTLLYNESSRGRSPLDMRLNVEPPPVTSVTDAPLSALLSGDLLAPQSAEAAGMGSELLLDSLRGDLLPMRTGAVTGVPDEPTNAASAAVLSDMIPPPAQTSAPGIADIFGGGPLAAPSLPSMPTAAEAPSDPAKIMSILDMLPGLQYEDSPQVKALKAKRSALYEQAFQPVQASVGQKIMQALAAAIPLAATALGGSKRDVGFMASALQPAVKQIEEERLRDVQLGRQQSLREAEATTEDIQEIQKKEFRRQQAEELLIGEQAKYQQEANLVDLRERIKFADQIALEKFKGGIKENLAKIKASGDIADPAMVDEVIKAAKAAKMYDVASSFEKRRNSKDNPVRRSDLADLNTYLDNLRLEKAREGKNYVPGWRPFNPDQEGRNDVARQAFQRGLMAHRTAIEKATELANLIDSNGGSVPLKGPKGEKAWQAISTLIPLIKQVRGYGANFTKYEIALAEGELGTGNIATLEGALRQKGVREGLLGWLSSGEVRNFATRFSKEIVDNATVSGFGIDPMVLAGDKNTADLWGAVPEARDYAIRSQAFLAPYYDKLAEGKSPEEAAKAILETARTGLAPAEPAKAITAPPAAGKPTPAEAAAELKRREEARNGRPQ